MRACGPDRNRDVGRKVAPLTHPQIRITWVGPFEGLRLECGERFVGRRRRGTARDAERPKAVGHERCGLEAETVGGREAGRGGVLGDGRRPEIDFTAEYK